MNKNAHVFKPLLARRCPWDYCIRCGLVALRNDATAQAIRIGCDWYAVLYPKEKK